MPMLSPPLASRAGPAQGPWEIFGRRESNGPVPGAPGAASSERARESPQDATEEDILLPLSKNRAASHGGIAPGSLPFRPFESARPTASLHVHNLPRDMTQRELHLMFTFANDYLSGELLREPGRTSATVKFRTMGGATAAQAVLEHRPDIFGEGSNWLKCEIRPVSSVSTPTTGQPPNIKSRFLFMEEANASASSANPGASAGSAISSIPSSGSSVSTIPGSGSLPSPVYTAASRLFDPLPRRPSNGTFDDKRPSPLRRASVPTRPINELSIQTSVQAQAPAAPHAAPLATPLAASHAAPHAASHAAPHATPPTPQQAHPAPHAASHSAPLSAPQSAPHATPHSAPHATPHSAPHSAPHSVVTSTGAHASEYDASKVVVPFGPGTSKAKAVSIMQSGGRVMPPANPADQNPPCNTLYVGNLPPDTQEEELKDLFSSHPGYKRLCFRTKANGPMCFVEFEDEVFAGKALEDLYGFGLSNSVKGGIRLSYSKNPLGVRSRQPQKY